MKIDVKKIIEDCLDTIILPNSASFQRYIKNRPQVLGEYKLTPSISNLTINQVLSEYKFYDVQKEDVVLDIGANVGGFSMFISKNVKQVYAVEPLYTDVLEANVSQNSIKNIKIFNFGLGNNPFTCEFINRKKVVQTKTLHEILGMCGKVVTFLKCDCEGGEWAIQPHELKGIRRIEAEIHSFNDENLYDFPDMLVKCGYTVDITNKTDHAMMVHAHKTNVNHTPQKTAENR